MDILKPYKKITTYRDRDRSKLYITPFREWGIILFMSAVLVAGSTLFSCYAFSNIYLNSFKESVVEQAGEDPYNINEFKTELSTVLQYYEKREQEHNALLEKQPILSEISVIKSFDIPDSQNNIDHLDSNNTSTSSQTETKTVSLKDDRNLKILDRVRSNISNTASVWKAFFVDPIK